MFFGKQDPAMLQRVEEARCVRLGGLEEGCISVAGCFVKERTPHLLFIGISRLQVAITIASRFFITHRMMQIGQETETGLLCTIASEEEAGRPAILVDEADTRTLSRLRPDLGYPHRRINAISCSSTRPVKITYILQIS